MNYICLAFEIAFSPLVTTSIRIQHYYAISDALLYSILPASCDCRLLT